MSHLDDVITPEEALRAEPDLALLPDLIAAGWSWRPMLDADNMLLRLDFWHRDGDYLDVVHVYGTGQAHAQRVHDDPHGRPGVTWQHDGPVGDTVRAVLGLPAPDHLLAPRLITARPRFDR